MNLQKAIGIVNDGPYKIFTAITGGGTGWVNKYLSCGGGSATILGAYIPYAQGLTDEFLGYTPDGYTTERVARDLALRSYEKTFAHGGGWDSIGIGVTASLTRVANERDSRVNKVFVCIHGNTGTMCGEFILGKNQPSGFECRKEQETVVENIIFNLLFTFIGIDFLLPLDNIIEQTLTFQPSIPIDVTYNIPRLVFPGSFNPLHDGHISMMNHAMKLFPSFQPIFEITLNNRDKKAIDWIDVRERALQFTTLGIDVCFTSKKTFAEKATLFADGSIFILGLDTAERLVSDLKILEQSGKEAPHKEFVDRYVKLLVFPRYGKTIDQISDYSEIFHIATDWEQIHISSTEIRKQKNNG